MYPYFTFDDLEYEYEFERENFPNEELWEKACEGCCPWSLNDFHAAEWRYEQYIKDKNFNPKETIFNFEF
jgi:hypothetical protein